MNAFFSSICIGKITYVCSWLHELNQAVLELLNLGVVHVRKLNKEQRRADFFPQVNVLVTIVRRVT